MIWSQSITYKEKDEEEDKKKSKQEQAKKFEEFIETEKDRKMQIKYKYFDGFQIQKTLTLSKSLEIGDFLEMARFSLLKEYPQLLEIKGRIGLFLVIGNSNFRELYHSFECEFLGHPDEQH